MDMVVDVISVDSNEASKMSTRVFVSSFEMTVVVVVVVLVEDVIVLEYEKDFVIVSARDLTMVMHSVEVLSSRLS
jgi:hypothetical protein